ncbi:hypothetical protein [Rhodococcus triatomae]|nr:putrescine oxidase [Rhodococcus triatomae BKS 15-14]
MSRTLTSVAADGSPSTGTVLALPDRSTIHFSCSDIAGAGHQHVDGAIRMGRRTAAAIVAACAQPV